MTKRKDDFFIVLSAVAVVLSGLVSLFNMQLWLAGTQWMLIAIVLGIYGLYMKNRD